MTSRDIVTDLMSLLHPQETLEASSSADNDPGGWPAFDHEAAEDREEVERTIRRSWENDENYDPLLSEIFMARHAMLAAEARVRLLIAYGREFVRPRPYRLEDLARASGMSISGVRTAYAQGEIAEVSRLTGTKPARRPPKPS